MKENTTNVNEKQFVDLSVVASGGDGEHSWGSCARVVLGGVI